MEFLLRERFQVRRDLIEWLVNEQLSEYRVLFNQDQEMAWLDHIDKRYKIDFSVSRPVD